MSEDEVDYGADVERGEYDSGPFCRHWGDPADCDHPCSRCGHKCHEHPTGEGCRVDGCPCEEFEE